MSAPLRTRLLLGLPGLALAAASAVVALEGPTTERLLNAVLAGVGGALVWSVAVAVRLRYPQRPLSNWLFLLAGAYALQPLIDSPYALPFTLARVLRPAVEWLLIWIMLAFPSGRLSGQAERTLVGLGAAAILLLWLPAVMFSQDIAMAGLYADCHPQCPDNLWHVADRPELAAALHAAFRVVAEAVLISTGLVLSLRLWRATPLLRRSLAPVWIAFIVRSVTIAGFLALGRHRWALTLSFWAVPASMAVGLLQGRLYVAAALQRLVSGLRTRPDERALRDVMARALDDASLDLAYWLPDSERWVDARGASQALTYPVHTDGRAVTLVCDTEGRPVAALLHDPALLEEPTLLEAVADSMQWALASQRMETALAASRANAASAAQTERLRLERDLHDGAQQRLIALRMKLGVVARLQDQDSPRARSLIQELGLDVDAAIQELREFAHGVMPPMLAERGLVAALMEAANRAGLPTRVELSDIGRVAPGIEHAVYFCCAEALQNAAKHGGAQARSRLRLWAENTSLRFEIANDVAGSGSDTEPRLLATTSGHGLDNMRHRMNAVGGTLTWALGPDGTFTVSGTIPHALSNRPA